MSINSGNKGLGNLGNTCYMNSALQCLSHLLEFHPKNDNFLNEVSKQKDDQFSQWYNLQIQLWENDNSTMIVPRDFLSMFINKCREYDIEFYNFHQNDTHEFIHILMDLLHRSIKKKVNISFTGDPVTNLDKIAIKAVKEWSNYFNNDYSYIIKKFYSQVLSITSCPECDYMTTNHEPIMILELEIPDEASTLNNCLDSYTKKISLDLENTWKCDKCKNHVKPEKKIILWKTSDVLIILLKRYNGHSKNNNFIEFPLDLDMSSYSLNYNKEGIDYNLSGMCIQDGSLGGGHYYAICKNELDKLWREYNDTSVNIVSEAYLLKQKPYCLFYRRNK